MTKEQKEAYRQKKIRKNKIIETIGVIVTLAFAIVICWFIGFILIG